MLILRLPASFQLFMKEKLFGIAYYDWFIVIIDDWGIAPFEEIYPLPFIIASDKKLD